MALSDHLQSGILFLPFFKGGASFLGGGRKHEIPGQAKENRKKDHLVQGFHKEFY